MKSLDLDTIRGTVQNLLNSLPTEQLNKIIYDEGVDSYALANIITNEFSLASQEEGFEPYLTKAALRSAPVSGKLPEHLRESLVETQLKNLVEIYLKNTGPLNNVEASKENKKKMTNYDNSQESGYEKLNKNYQDYKPYNKVPTITSMDREQLLPEELETLRNRKVGFDMPAPAYSGEEMQHAIHALHQQIQQSNGIKANNQLATAAVNNNAFLDAFKHVGSTIGGQLKGAVTAEVSARINRALVGYARQAFPQLPQGPMADTVLGFAIPSILLLVAHSVREAGPESIGISRQITDGVETTAKAALAGVSRDAISTVVDQAVPMLSFVAAMSSGHIPDQLSDGQEV